MCQVCIKFYKKGWATFWPTFSKTHMATLATASYVGAIFSVDANMHLASFFKKNTLWVH
jgi:hypothetical protein